MKALTPIASAQFEDQYGSTYYMYLSKSRDEFSSFPWVTSWATDDDGYCEEMWRTPDELRAHVDNLASQWSCNLDHDDEDEIEQDDCDECGRLDELAAWRHIVAEAYKHEGNYHMAENMMRVAQEVLDAETVNHLARYPHARAVFSWDADREAIIGAVVRGLQLAGVDQDEVDQFSYEARTSPDVLAVARQWVTVS